MLNSELSDDINIQWRTGHLRGASGTSQMISWLPVANLPVKGGLPLRLAVSSGGHWLGLCPDGDLLDFALSGNYWPLFPLLEIPYEEARAILRSEFIIHNVKTEWVNRFPFEEIVIKAFESGSQFWSEDALSWVPSLSPSAEIDRALQTLTRLGKTQRQRHLAQTYLARRKRSS